MDHSLVVVKGLVYSVKLWAMLCRVTQGRIIVKSSDKMWSTGGGNGKPLQYSTSPSLITWKPLTVWITTNCGKFFKDGNTASPYLSLEKPMCRSINYSKNLTWNSWLVQNWERSMTRLYFCHLVYITYMQSQFSLIPQLCPTLCYPMDCSTPGPPVHRQLPEFIQTHVHRVGDAIQPSHPLLSPSPSAFNLPQHQSLFQWISSSHQVAQVLEFQLQHQSFQWLIEQRLYLQKMVTY